MTKPTMWLCAQRRLRSAWILSYPLNAQRRLWSDWANAQADLSLRWAHSHFVGFVMRRLILSFRLTIAGSLAHRGLTSLFPLALAISVSYEPLSPFHHSDSNWIYNNWAASWQNQKITVHPAKTQINLGIRPVWSESLLCAQCVAKDQSFLHVDSEDSDQTGRMPRLIGVFAGRTRHFVGFVMRL